MLSLLKTKKEDSALLRHAAHLAGRVSKGAPTPEAASQARNSCAAPRAGLAEHTRSAHRQVPPRGI